MIGDFGVLTCQGNTVKEGLLLCRLRFLLGVFVNMDGKGVVLSLRSKSLRGKIPGREV